MREFTECRTVLQNELRKSVDFFSWPVNQCDEDAHALALEAGYSATTCLERPNVPGVDATRIGRTYFGQSERSMRIGRPWVVDPKFRGLVRWLSGRRRGYPKIFLANRLVDWYSRSGHGHPEAGHIGV